MLSDEVAEWARMAGYHIELGVDEDSPLALTSRAAATRYHVFVRARGRLELTQVDDGDDERSLLFAASVSVMEHYLMGLFGDDIRDSAGLPFLEMPWTAEYLHPSCTLSEMVGGYRTLRGVDGAPLAAAKDATLSMLALVPLSHFLQVGVPALKRSYLHKEGSPLLRDGRYG